MVVNLIFILFELKMKTKMKCVFTTWLSFVLFRQPIKMKNVSEEHDEKKKVKHDIIYMYVYVYIVSYHRKCNYSPLNNTFLHDALFINQLQHRFGLKAHKKKLIEYNNKSIQCAVN